VALVVLAVVELAVNQAQALRVLQTLAVVEVLQGVQRTLFSMRAQVALASSSSLTLAHNSLAVAQSHQAVATQSILLLLAGL
tara:strand:+ start:333 stop:578 length:246 start_codon:yes stop_codon:yes gene_type:complete